MQSIEGKPADAEERTEPRRPPGAADTSPQNRSGFRNGGEHIEAADGKPRPWPRARQDGARRQHRLADAVRPAQREPAPGRARDGSRRALARKRADAGRRAGCGPGCARAARAALCAGAAGAGAGGRALGAEDVSRAAKMLRQDARAELSRVFDDTVLVAARARPIAPKGLAQKRYVEAIRRDDIVFGIGPAGTGKTYLAMAMAVRK